MTKDIVVRHSQEIPHRVAVKSPGYKYSKGTLLDIQPSMAVMKTMHMDLSRFMRNWIFGKPSYIHA